VALKPGDTRPVDVAAHELGLCALGREVAQHPAGAAAEVEYAPALPGPVLGQRALENRTPRAAEFQEELQRPVRAADCADSIGELERRQWQVGRL